MVSSRKLLPGSLFAVGALLVAGTVLWAVRARQRPEACPFSQRFWLDLPRPFMRRASLVALLQPMPGERVLEIGPGAGFYSLEVAPRLLPHGQLDVLDVQQAMLDELRQRRAVLHIDNMVETLGDARQLPYPHATFDAAFLVATLGEIPANADALQELHRVLKPGGRLVVGEGQPDPHMVPVATLQTLAESAGFRHERTSGYPFGYFARFVAIP